MFDPPLMLTAVDFVRHVCVLVRFGCFVLLKISVEVSRSLFLFFHFFNHSSFQFNVTIILYSTILNGKQNSNYNMPLPYSQLEHTQRSLFVAQILLTFCTVASLALLVTSMSLIRVCHYSMFNNQVQISVEVFRACAELEGCRSQIKTFCTIDCKLKL